MGGTDSGQGQVPPGLQYVSPKNITHHHHDITSNAIIRLPIPPSNAVIFLQVMQGQGLLLGDNYSL